MTEMRGRAGWRTRQYGLPEYKAHTGDLMGMPGVTQSGFWILRLRWELDREVRAKAEFP